MISVLLLATALTFSSDDAEIAWGAARDLVESHSPRDAGTIRGGIAANRILDLASASGADVRKDVFTAPTPNGEGRFVNLYAEFESDRTSRWVVVVSHYDTKPGTNCPGANDGASTSGLLVGLANALSSWHRPHGNVMLVWTDGEECLNGYDENDGLQGSRRAVEYIRQKGRLVQAVICIDMLGDRDLKITVPKNGSPALGKIAVHAAKRIGEPDLVTLSKESVTDDHVSFLKADMKAVDLIDFSYGPNNSWWHTPEDTLDKISRESLEKSGRLIAEMLNILL